jgi:hypothetical protein
MGVGVKQLRAGNQGPPPELIASGAATPRYIKSPAILFG